MFDKRLMDLCPESRKYIVGNVLLQWLELCLNTGMIFIIAGCAEILYSGTMDRKTAVLAILGMLLTMAGRFGTSKYAVRMSFEASRTVKKKLRTLIYEKLLSMGNGYRAHVSTAELVQESVEGVDQLESYFGQYMPQFFYAFLAPVTLFFLFGFLGSWKTAIVLLVCVPLIPGAIMMVQKIAKKLLSRYWGQYTQLGSTFLENLEGMTTLKIYHADEYKNEQMNRESENFRFITMKVLTMQLNSIIIMDLFAYGGAAIGILLATREFLAGTIGLSACLAMILLSADFFLPMRRLGSAFHVAMNGMAASDRIFRFLQTEVPERETVPFPDSCELKLSEVTFSYEPEREVLHQVSITVPEHGFIGIVGESGSGKSTIASLLMGKNHVSAGSVQIGNVLIEDIAEDERMRNMTYVGSGSYFFRGSIRENLQMANGETDDDALWSVLERCHLAEDMKALQGLDTQLLENASNLSGGQRQRLALCRAILHHSPVYIFDEATSNIDVESENLIQEQIHEMVKEKTVVMISHRLANVIGADFIYCMEAGSVVEAGRHEQLLAKHGMYAKLWDTQQALEQYGKEA